MSYATLELSVNSGQPIELYDFKIDGQHYYLTSSPVDVTYLDILWESSSITRDRIKQTSDSFKNDLSLTFPITNNFALQFIKYAQENVTTLTIFRKHVGDSEYKTYWKGRVVGAEASNNSIVLICESIFTALRRTGIRAKFEYSCRHALYSTGCSVNKNSYSYSGSVTSVSDNKLTLTLNISAVVDDNYFTGGYLTIDNITRYIVSHVGDTVVINSPFQGDIVNKSLIIYAGCNHNKSTCDTKFLNVLNFGGFPYIPSKNPFGSSIY
jgi:uncharacterized phage protein (TIGR02218 family)